ncbi:MAG: sulfur oxidation c-type cytochrome SoxX [Thiobacillaceae bacterium]|jgi:sulfur oxidation c-type cytochrome SoxX|nr:sulfur oxidation c-type cytochrome SoxX [Thiobacillaceae bacterium]
MHGSTLVGLFLLALAIPGLASNPPPDAAVDPSAEIKTLAPKVVVKSGRLEWEAHKRDLTPWVTLSHEDRRPTPKPRRVDLNGQLNGDAERGRTIAMSTLKGGCVNCHTLPGEDWPGSVGHLLMSYRKRGNSDAHVYQQIFDPRVFNPNTVMPAFGTFGLLNDQEIRDLVAYLQSLN